MQNHEDQFEEKKVLGEWTSKLKDRQFSPELIQGSKFIRGGIHRGAEVKFSCFNHKFRCEQCFEHQARGNYLSFLGMIGSVEKVPLVELQLYFLIFKPEFTWI